MSGDAVAGVERSTITAGRSWGDGQRWRLVDDLDRVIDARGQMAADVALLDGVATGGLPVLRLYRWRPPALSLGRFQRADDVDVTACERHGVDVVRRPTGGRALLHGGDLTYAVAFPEPSGGRHSVGSIYATIASGLIGGLARLGVHAEIGHHRGPGGAVCMATPQGADLRVGSRKVCGSAQLRRGGVVLQHGSVLLTRLEFDETDLVVGDHDRAALRAATVTLEELGAATEVETVGGALVEGFSAALDVDLRSTHGAPAST